MEPGFDFLSLQDKYKDSDKEHTVKNIFLIFMCLAFLGCAYINPLYTSSIEDCADRIAKNISTGLEASYLGVSVLVSTPVEAATYSPSDFGLVLQEFLISSMVKRNANVVDVQLRQEPYITCEEGLIALSRDASRLKGEFRAEVIVVSTYMVREESVAITSRAIDFTTNDVITSSTATLYMSPVVSELLDRKKNVRVYEK
jgi:hypothetical protein